MSHKRSKVLLIDWFKTLSASKFWGHWENDENDKFIKIEKYIFGSSNGIANNWMTGNLDSESAIAEISKNLNIPYSDLFDHFVISCRQMKFIDKSLPLLINAIKNRGSSVYIFSDNMDSLERWTAPALKLENIFDSIINSFNVKFLKNHVDKTGRNYFLNEALKTSGGNLENMVLFDDNVSTIDLFRSLGIETHLVTNDHTLADYLKEF